MCNNVVWKVLERISFLFTSYTSQLFWLVIHIVLPCFLNHYNASILYKLLRGMNIYTWIRLENVWDETF